MSGEGSLLEVVQGLLERTYRMRTDLRDIGRFVVGDAGYRTLYRHDEPVVSGSGYGDGARTLVRETECGVRACIYYPDDLIATLERHPPHRGLHEENVDAFATLVEEVDHLLCIAERVRQERGVSLFELELHANVSKHLVLTRFLSGASRPLDGERRAWLRWHLFHKGSPADPDAAVCERYRDAIRWALRFLDTGSRLRPRERIDALRRFHAAGAAEKLELIRGLPA